MFVAEITGKSGIEWSLFYKSKSFYGLIIFTFLIYIYNKALYAHQKEINSFLDNDYCIAYMRSKCLPEAAEKYRKMVLPDLDRMASKLRSQKGDTWSRGWSGSEE